MRKSLKSSTFSAFMFQNFSCLRNFFRLESLKNNIGFRKGAEKVEQCFEASHLVKLQQDIQIFQNMFFTEH